MVRSALLPNRFKKESPGEVYLIGAGPGDPELLTLMALRLLQRCDAVLYDHLVAREIVAMARPEAERIYVGKQCSHHHLPQHEINMLLVRLAKSGRKVARLKGGDPFIFGRGGEEIEALAAAGIRFEVVPGITAASGIACYAGIPLTHRDYAHTCVMVAGHLKDGSINLNWETLARPRQTVVIYMGLGSLEEICRQLIAHGAPVETPAAIVEQGTTSRQKVVIGTLDTLPPLKAASALKPPCLIIVGEVVRLHSRLSWFGAFAGTQRVQTESRFPTLSPAARDIVAAN
jgi:uroporphyrin-III C-methyltransferase/precorrin-2 dehydrogenase/sirohydrochlorin ferrochelatase